jgi:hypothetical protein
MVMLLSSMMSMLLTVHPRYGQRSMLACFNAFLGEKMTL